MRAFRDYGRINAMKTCYLRIGDIDKDGQAFVSVTEAVRQAGEVIRAGGLVAFPAETVYGLGADACSEDAARKIYAAKGRPSDNPLIVHIAEIGKLGELASEIPEAARRLADVYWPGPLTMIFHKTGLIPDATTGGRNTVAVRYPDQPTAQAFIRAAGGLICAPSANLSGRPSPTNAHDVLEDMDGRIDLILDDGSSIIGLESTIVDMTAEPPVMLRPGAITPAMLKDVVPEIDTEGGTALENEEHPRAPGMKYRHYAPHAPLTIVEAADGQSEGSEPAGGAAGVVETINRLVAEAADKGQKAGVLTCTEHADLYPGAVVKSLGSMDSEEEMARHLFTALREFDREDVDVIYSESFTRERIGFALMNRLLKAAAKEGR